MQSTTKYEMEALAYHEAIPGHHMQIALAIENKTIPEFRRHSWVTAYGEGWGLYSERLPKEYGFYQDPYSDFGRLAMELWRACRLVVDTGVHSKKWTREQAIQYLNDNTPGSPASSETAIGRYIIWPGQATAYMVGMLKILELRAKAKQNLGGQFDIRDFHHQVLRQGTIPLNLLEENIQAWITHRKEQKIMRVIKNFRGCFLFLTSLLTSINIGIGISISTFTGPLAVADSHQTLEEQIAARKAKTKAKMPQKVRQVFVRATKELRASGIEQKAIQKGPVPNFRLGGKDFKEYLKNGPVVLKFYRGHWCPYCQLELAAYEKNMGQFKKKNVQVIALAPDKKLYIERTKRRHKLSFPVFSDKDNAIARKFNLVYKLDSEVGKIYQKFGKDIPLSQGNDRQELPLPATYLINQQGEIIFAFVSADYTQRIDPLKVLTKLK